MLTSPTIATSSSALSAQAVRASALVAATRRVRAMRERRVLIFTKLIPFVQVANHLQ